MRNSKKKIILAIIILLVAVVIILIVGKKKKEQPYNETPVDIYGEYQKNRETEGKSAKDEVAREEDNMNEYMTVQSIVSKFNRNVLYLNATAEDLDLIVTKNQEANVLAKYKQEGTDFIKNVLAPNYKTKYSVDDKYINNMLANYSKLNYVITDMYVIEDSEYINTYFVYGLYGETEFNFIIVLDRYNNTYQIYLNNYFKEQGYSKSNINSMKTLNISSIENNGSNTFQYRNIEREQVAQIYYDEYLDIIKNNKKIAYNMLDSEYKKARFDTIEKFNDYVKNLPTGNKARMASYTITQGDGYDEYLCKDALGNNFIFKVTGAMKYSVILDTYTTNVLAYENEYKNASAEKKVKLSFNRFFECINNKDYERAYGYLNKTFRENEFPTLDEFKQYVESNWFNVNSFTYQSMEVSVNETYSVYGTIHDYELEGSYDAGFLNKTFYIKLGSDYNNFEVSFGK
ncbi:MAG: hypothetical protein IJH12_01805 [Clostridia bacterium]|nr:hypothetical protein [Clostridia bacterium]